MIIAGMLLFGAALLGFLHRLYYLPTQTEKKTALGVALTKEGLEDGRTRQIVRQYRTGIKRALFTAGAALLLSAAAVFQFGRKGFILEAFSLLFIWEILFYLYQKYRRKMILLKLDNQWNDDTRKRACFIREHIGIHNLELANDLVFVPLFILPFRAFFYPGVREYLQGDLRHGLLCVLPFLILLFLLAVYYKGSMDRNLIFLFACVEAAAMYAFQRKVLAEGLAFPNACMMYLLFLLLGITALLPYLRDVRTDEELYGREFPVSMFSEGEEYWLYGYCRNKKIKTVWVRKAKGWLPGMNHAPVKAKVLLLFMQAAVYGGIAVYIWEIFG